MSILNYHGYVTYNFGEADTKVRPYVLIGAGATHFSSARITGILVCPAGQLARRRETLSFQQRGEQASSSLRHRNSA